MEGWTPRSGGIPFREGKTLLGEGENPSDTPSCIFVVFCMQCMPKSSSSHKIITDPLISATSDGLIKYTSTLLFCVFIGERAKRARHYQGCTNSSLCGIYIYMYGGTCAIIVAHATHT